MVVSEVAGVIIGGILPLHSIILVRKSSRIDGILLCKSSIFSALMSAVIRVSFF
jgi:hypothetical protein